MCSEVLNMLISTGSFFNNAAVGAFVGSFSAFSLGLVAYDYSKKREKWVAHHNALVQTERLLNRHLNDLSGNIHILKGAVKTLSDGKFTYNDLHSLETPDYMVEFLNIELVNVYVDYESLLRQLNKDMNTWNRANRSLFETALSGKVDQVSLKANREELISKANLIRQFSEDLIELTYTTNAYIRMFMKKDKRDKFARLEMVGKVIISKSELAKERKKVIEESLETIEQDKKRLDKYEM